MEIENPYVIVHKPLRAMGKVETVLAGPPDVKMEHFALAIADAIRHVAKWARCDELDVLRRVQEELDEPTTEIMGGGVQ